MAEIVREITSEIISGMKPTADLSMVKVHLLDNKSRQAHFYQAPVNFKDASSGLWKPINTSMKDTTAKTLDGETYDMEVTDHFFQVRMKKNAKAPQRIDIPGKGALVVKAVGGNSSVATVKENVATYTNAWNDVDWVRTVKRTGFKSDLVIKKPTAQSEFRFKLSGVGLTYKLQDNGDLHWLKDSAFVARFPAPTVYDANGKSGKATQTVVDDELIVSIDAEWFAAAFFPVTLDPSATFSVAASADDFFVEKSGASYPPTSAATLIDGFDNIYISKGKSGATYYVDMGAARWDTSSLDDTAIITSATLRIYAISRDGDADSRNLTADWYTGSWDATSWTSTAGTDALSGFDLSSISIGASNDFTLSGYATGVSKTGYTALRLHISGDAPSGLNEIRFASYDHATLAEPRLIVGYYIPKGLQMML